MQRLALSAAVVMIASAVVNGCAPSVPAPTGGGAAGAGRAGGTASAGGTAGGAAGAGVGGGSGTTRDAGCVELQAVAPPFSVPGGFFVTNDRAFEWWIATIALVSQQSNRLTYFNVELYQQAQNRLTFPAVAAIPAMTTYENCQACFTLYVNCDSNGDNCQGGSFLGQSGSFEFDEGTQSFDAGRFVGRATNVVYEQWNFQTDTATGGQCFRVPSMSFTAVWPSGRDGGM